MTLFERQILKEFLAGSVKLLLLFVCFTLLYLIPDLLDGGDSLDAARLISCARSCLVSIEIALIIACPLAMVLTILDMKKSGILTAFLGTGAAVGKLRRVVLVSAAATLFLSAGTCLLSSRLEALHNADRQHGLLRADPVSIWNPRGNAADRWAGEILLFHDDSLDVVRAVDGELQRGNGFLRFSSLQPLSGSIDPFDSVIVKRGKGIGLETRETAALLEAGPGAGFFLFVNRICIGAVLLVLSSYLALLAPISRQWMVCVAFLLLAPLIGLGFLWCSILLQRDLSPAFAAEAVWAAVLALAVIFLDRAFRRRGIRST